MWRESQFQELGDSQFGSPKKKRHLDVAPVVCHKEYYKGKVMVSPKFGPWWIL